MLLSRIRIDDMNSIFDGMFQEDFAMYYWKAEIFDRAAIEVEALANRAEEEFGQIQRKNVLERGPDVVGKFVSVPVRPEDVMRGLEMNTRDVAIYLYAHALELRLKGLCFQKIGERPNRHSVKELYDKVKNHLELQAFDEDKLSKLFIKLDEILLWAGRYPSPNKRHKIKELTQTSKGYSDDIRTLLYVDFAELFHNFRKYVANITSIRLTYR